MIVAERMSDVHIREYDELDTAVRKVNQTLTYRLMNLTGIVFRMWFCGEPPVYGGKILDQILANESLSPSHAGLFRKWYAAKLQYSGHGVAIWREVGAEDTMIKIECTAENIASSRAWLAENGNE